MCTVVQSERIAGVGRAILWATIHGLGATIVTNWTFVRAPTLPLAVEHIVRMAIILVLLTAIPIYMLYERIISRRMIVYSVTYALNLVLWSRLIRYCHLQLDIPIPLLYRPGLNVDYLFPSNLLVAGLAGSWLGWGLARWRRGPIVVQNGTQCPGCAYSLLGCVAQVCPECGREFTFQELGTTKQEFTMKRAQQVGAADFSRAD